MTAARLLEGFLGAALLLAALAKTADLDATGAALVRLRLPSALARPVVAVEAAAAVALLLGLAPAAATSAALALGGAFVAVQLRARETGGCGCLGAFDRSLPPGVALARAGVFLACAAAAWALRLSNGTLALGARPAHLLAGAAGAALAVATLVVARAVVVRARVAAAG